MSIFPHTVTAWVKGTNGRQTVWDGPEILTRVRLDESFGAIPGIQGDTSKRSALLLMPGTSEPLDQGDRVMMGTHTDATPPQESFVVETTTPIYIRNHVHHWELTLA